MALEVLHDICDILPEPTLLVRTDGTILLVNRAARSVLGFEPERVVGQQLSSITTDDPNKLHELMRLWCRSHEFLPGALSLRQGDGQVEKYRVLGGRLAARPGADYSSIVIIRVVKLHTATAGFRILNERIQKLHAEILYRERVQAELQAQREWLKTTLTSIGDGVIATDNQGRVILLNRVAEELTGWTEEQARGQPIDMVFHIVNEYTRCVVDNPVATVLETGRIVGLANHTLLIRRDGREIPIDDSGAPIRDGGGVVTGAVLVFTDVSGRRRSEAELRTSEEQFRTLANTIPNLAWMANPDGHIFWYNRRWYEYTGTTPQEMEGWGWQRVHDPAVLPAVMERWKNSLVSGEPFEMVFPLRGVDGLFHPFLTRVEPVKDETGRVVRWFGTNTDIAAQQETEARLVGSIEELRRANRELEEFAYVSSHDMQEPLRMVNIYTQLLLKRSLGHDKEAEQYAGFIRQGVARMRELIRDLLSYSRVIHEAGAPVTLAADLSDSLAQALELLKAPIEETRATITAGPLPAVAGETGQFAHVFQNLLSNSLKYRKKEVAPDIRITARRAGNQWTICVRDNGIGFDPRYANRIFGLFKRLHKDEYPGTGLGLAICQRIVERTGGRIWAEGELGRGAAVYFTVAEAQPGSASLV